MSGFYVSLIFIGILLVVVSLVLILIDKKNILIFRKTFDDKKQELVEIINDAEQMIDELNRFSDYIVSQIDVKNEELNSNLKEAEQKLNDLYEKAGNITISRKAVGDVIESGHSEGSKEIINSSKTVTHSVKKNDAGSIVSAQAAVNTPGAVTAAYSKGTAATVSAVNRKKDKVIPLNNRYSEVLRLSREGMDDLEIAKSLNMGKGEVELVIGLKR